MSNLFKTGLGAALVAASLNTASAEETSTTLIGPNAMGSFFTCATRAMTHVSGNAVAYDNADSELGTHHMRVSAEGLPAADKGATIALSVEWSLGKDSAPVSTFDATGTLTAAYAIIEPPSHGRFATGKETVTSAQASTSGHHVDVKVGGNENSNSQLRSDVSKKAQELMGELRSCVPSPSV